jgi:hypothetical protein
MQKVYIAVASALAMAAIGALSLLGSGAPAGATDATSTGTAQTSRTAGVTRTAEVTRTVTATPTGGEGCTPGYWKVPVHHDSWPPTGFSTGQTVGSVFDNESSAVTNATLVQALNFGGGPDVAGAERILLRAAVAALLNSAHPGVDYPMSTAAVMAAVNAALASDDRDTMLDLAGDLDDLNNAGCPLD